MAAGIFHKFKDLAYRGFAEELCYLYFQQTRLVNAAAENFVSCQNAARNGFSGKRRRIQSGLPAEDDAVQRDLFSGLYYDHIADFHFVRVNLFRVSALKQDVCIVRADIHKLRNGLSGFTHRVVLEKLANLIEKHNRHSLRKLARRKSSKRCHSHEEVFVENLSPADVPQRFPKNLVSDFKICNKIKRKFENIWLCRSNHRRRKQNRSDHQSNYSLFHPTFPP